MGVLLTYAHDGVVYLGMDSHLSLGERKLSGSNLSDIVVQKMDNGLLVGICDSWPLSQAVCAHPEIFDFDKDVTPDKKYIVKNIIPKLIDALQQEGVFSDNNGIVSMNNCILLVWKDSIWEIGHDFAVRCYKHYCTAGKTGSFAYYSLSQVDSSKDINEQLIAALKIVEQHCIEVRRPFFLIDTKTLEFRKVEG